MPDLPPTAIFQEKVVPPGTALAGWAALAETLAIAAPVRQPAAIAEQHVAGGKRKAGDWTIFDKRYAPGADAIADHLTFALRHETLDLLILKRVFDAVPRTELEALVRAAPTGITARRLWYFYEILTGRTLDVPDAAAGAIDLIDPKAYFTGKPRLSRRHRVRDNLLGGAAFCPIVRRTAALTRFVELDLAAHARETVGRISAQLVARAASFLLLNDSRSSFEIEGQRPPRNRLERWGRAILQAGRNPLTLDEIMRLQRVLMEDDRFVQPGLRRDGVFLGERDQNHDPLPEFIGARPADLPELMGGLLDANNRMRDDEVEPVIKAAATAFGFVYIHPFQDGNGRMHRCLVHHVLAERQFTPAGMIFPVSSVMLDRIEEYRATLQAHSAPLMPFIEWRTTPERNVEVLNDTADLYRYFDATANAEFLYACVQRTVDEDLPQEIDYLRRRDEALRLIMDTVEMPDRLAEDLILFIRQNHGVLSKRRREGEFQALRDPEVAAIEAIVRDTFDGYVGRR